MVFCRFSSRPAACEEGNDEDEDHAQVAEEVAEDGVWKFRRLDHLLGVNRMYMSELLVGAEQPEKKYDR